MYPWLLTASSEYLAGGKSGFTSPLHPNISMQILHTILFTLHEILTRRICLTNYQELL